MNSLAKNTAHTLRLKSEFFDLRAKYANPAPFGAG